MFIFTITIRLYGDRAIYPKRTKTSNTPQRKREKFVTVFTRVKHSSFMSHMNSSRIIATLF
jgi:hypothetical protein